MRVALTAAAGFLLLLSGCSSTEPGVVASSSPSPPEQGCTFDATVDGVTAVREPGTNPTVTITADATPPKQLVIEDLCPGTGTAAGEGDIVVTNYALAPYSTKQQLESSFDRGQPLTLPLLAATGTIPGFLKGLEGMKPGGVRLVLIPGSQAYGKTPPPGSPFEPNEAFAFVMQLELVNPGASPVAPTE